MATYAIPDAAITELSYPVSEYPQKVSAIKLEDEKRIRAMLTGIRGQYLYFDGNKVINLRKYSGFEIVASTR
jgi:hypothetical protein